MVGLESWFQRGTLYITGFTWFGIERECGCQIDTICLAGKMYMLTSVTYAFAKFVHMSIVNVVCILYSLHVRLV